MKIRNEPCRKKNRFRISTIPNIFLVFIEILFLQISLVLIFILAVIIYRTLVQIPLFQNETLRPVAQMIASMSGAMVNLCFIMMLGRLYEKLALKLTTWGKIIHFNLRHPVCQNTDYTHKASQRSLLICRWSKVCPFNV